MGPVLKVPFEDRTHLDDSGSPKPDSTSAEAPLAATVQADNPVSNNTFEGFLTDVEHFVPDAGQLLLFSGEHLRLEVMLLRHQKNPRVIWGLKRHEDWAFKATLLRFARSSEPVQLILLTRIHGAIQVQGWVVQRTMHDFWASSLAPEYVHQFLESCPASYALEPVGSA